MRKWIGILLVIDLVIMSVAALNIHKALVTQQENYAHDIARAYQQGVEHGKQEAIDTSPDLEALVTLFSTYPAIKDPALYARCVIETAVRYRVPRIILAGGILQESSGNPLAVSSCGAIGLTQVRWKFWGEKLKAAGIAEKEEDLFKPSVSIEAKGFILRLLIDQHGSLDKALRHYSGNAGDYMEKIIRRVVG